MSKQPGQNLKHSHPASSGPMSANSNGRFTSYNNGLCVSVNDEWNTPSNPSGACVGIPKALYGGNNIGNGRWIGYIDYAGINVEHNHKISVDNDGGDESRPVNYTIRVWKRTA